jgi:uncharacterized protein (DUF2461 family)
VALDFGKRGGIHREAVFHTDSVSAEQIARGFQRNSKAVCESLRRVDIGLGGSFVAETLMQPLAELAEAYRVAALNGYNRVRELQGLASESVPPPPR